MVAKTKVGGVMAPIPLVDRDRCSQWGAWLLADLAEALKPRLTRQGTTLNTDERIFSFIFHVDGLNRDQQRGD